MSEFVRQQQAYMDEALPRAPWVDRATLTPLGDVAHHASLMAARDYLPSDLSESSMLIVNCGSGVDTRFFELEGVGAMYVTDISREGLRVTGERCGPLRSVLADTGVLPFADDCFDFVGVRSGLHHLEEPYVGLEEMYRVCKRGCFFIEGHATPLVPLFVKLGMLEAEEEAGNDVFRFTRTNVQAEAKKLGAHRCNVTTGWYMQIPWLINAITPIPGKLPASIWRCGLACTNAVLGGFGNCFIAYLEKRPA